MTEALTHLAEHAFQPFTVIMYNKNNTNQSVDDERRDLLCKKNKSMNHIPPTQDALLGHLKRAAYQGNIWTTNDQSIQQLPSPVE